MTEKNISISSTGERMLRCSRCKEDKPLSPEFFYHSKETNHGFSCFCKICANKSSERWRKTEKGKMLRIQSRKRNIKTTKEYAKRILSIRRISETIRRKTDPSFALKNRVRILMYASLRNIKNSRRWQDLVGYSTDDLRRHIEKQFKDGMSWERFLAGEIHIDHKIPITAFNFTKPEDIDFLKCWALKNLQPMWGPDNISKGNKISKPFQPSLNLG
jgi:hypothetical protein